MNATTVQEQDQGETANGQPHEPEPSRDAFVPAQVFHPAEYIRDELTARGWDLDTLTTHALGIVPRAADDPEWIAAWSTARFGWDLYMAVAGSEDGVRLGEDGALGLERALGIDAEFWDRCEKLWLAAPASRRSPPSDNEDLLSDEIGANIAALNERQERERAESPAVSSQETP